MRLEYAQFRMEHGLRTAAEPKALPPLPNQSTAPPGRGQARMRAIASTSASNAIAQRIGPVRAFGFETGLAIKRDRRFVVGKDGQFDAADAEPVVGCIDQGCK
ncbi:hypothetical protein D3C72_2262750 [compost metagenome]